MYVYALQFQITPHDEQSPTSLCFVLRDQVFAWITQKYQRDLSVSENNFSQNDGLIRPISGHEIKWNSESCNHAHLHTVEFVHPGTEDSSIFWRTSCRIANTKEKIEFSVVIDVSSPDFNVKPTNLPVGRPRFVQQILSEYRCSINDFPIATKPRQIGVAQVDLFVNETLYEKKRPLPVVVVSRDVHTETPTVNVDDLQNRLIGFADVVVLADKWAAYELTNHVGKFVSCYDGAVMVYWPDFPRNATPRDRHLRDDILGYEIDGYPLGKRLFDQMSELSSLRYSEGQVIRQVRADVAKQRALQFEELRNRVNQEALDGAEFRELFNLASDENKRLSEEVERLQRVTTDLEKQNENLQNSLRTVWQYSADGSSANVPPSDQEGNEDFSSVAEAIEAAKQKFSDTLVIWQSAEDAARTSQFARPEQVYRALLAIAEVGRGHFAQLTGGPSVGPWESAFKDRGFDYAASEHQTTLTKYGKHRDFSHNGQRRRMLRHLTLGGGDRTNCLQIYFEPDEELSQICVGYCGPHLPYSNQRT